MSDQTTVPNTQMLTVRPPVERTLLKRALNSPSLMIGFIWLAVIAIVAFALPPLLGLDPYAVEPTNRLEGPSAAHWFGTDTYGRDLFARILSGASTSITVGFVVALISAVLGAAIGVLAAFSPVLDQVLMRICDGLMAIPAILLAVALTAALGPNVSNLIIALSVVYTPGLARLVRSKAMAIKSETFVEASRVQGAKPVHIMIRHILPNTLSVLFVQSTFTFAESVITEAALSFLGAGVPAPQASWGNILNDGKSVIMQAPHMVIFTSLFLVLTVLALNLVGDGLRDLVDQRSQPQPKRTGFLSRMFGFGTARFQPTVKGTKR